jgi:hypothetical protein
MLPKYRKTLRAFHHVTSQKNWIFVQNHRSKTLEIICIFFCILLSSDKDCYFLLRRSEVVPRLGSGCRYRVLKMIVREKQIWDTFMWF